MRVKIDLEMLIHQQYQFLFGLVQGRMVGAERVYDQAHLGLMDHCYL